MKAAPEILEAVAKHFDLPADALASRDRSPRLAQARRVAILLLTNDGGLSQAQAAKELGVHEVTAYRWMRRVTKWDREQVSIIGKELG